MTRNGFIKNETAAASLIEVTPFLSIIIPLYNEEQRLMDGFKSICSYLETKSYTWEIILVDDGSADSTYEMLLNIKSHHPYKNVHILKNEGNKGKGYAVKKGILFARGDVILFTDIDLSVPVSYIDAFVAKILEGYDAAIGSREMEGSKVEVYQSFVREFMGNGFTFISNLLLGINFSDHTCGMKAFKKTSAHALFSRQMIERWAFDSEILYLIKKMGYMVAEVPVLWRNMPGTKVKMFKDAVRSFIDIVKIRFYHNGRIG